MKHFKRYITLVCLSVLSPLATHAQSDTLRLGLDEAIALAKRQNLSVQSAQVGVERADKERQVSLAKLFPTVGLNAQYGYTLKKQKVYFGSESASPNPMAAMMPADGIEMGQKHNLSTTLNATLPLIAPQLWASLALDKLSVERALEQLRASQLGLVSELRKAYLGALWAEASLDVLHRSLANMQANYQNIKDKYAQGLVAEYDLLRMETQVNNLRPTIIQTEQQVHLAKMKLLVLMNLETERPLSLSAKLSDYEARIQADLLGGRDSLDLSGNQTLRDLDLSLRQVATGIKVKRAEYLPSLGLAFNYTQSYASDLFKLDNKRRWTPHAMLALSLSVPLFSGGSTAKGLSSLRLQGEQLRLQRLNVERQLSLQSRSAEDALSYAREQYQTSRQAVRSADKGLQIAQMRYKVGASTLLELNDAELVQRQAQLNQAQAIYNYMLALYALDELQGK